MAPWVLSFAEKSFVLEDARAPSVEAGVDFFTDYLWSAPGFSNLSPGLGWM
jgi:hypothetical protein